MRNSVLLAVLLTLLSLSLLAQEPLQHLKKIYISPEGKMYVNKDLPMYFWVSTSGAENAQKFLLKASEESKPYVNPSYMDTEGINTFRSPSKVDTVTKEMILPESDIIWELRADSRAPVTNFSFDNRKSYKNADVYYFSEKIELIFKTTDETSGVEATYYSINGAPYTVLKDNIRIETETLHLIKFYSVDNVGNVEQPKEIQVKIDITKPVTELVVEGDIYTNILSPRSAIKLTASDENSKIKNTFYALNENPFTLYRQPVSLANIREGEHTITYYSVDNSGNEEDKKSYSFYLDKTPPMLVDELIGNTFIANGKEYSSGRSKIKLTAMDNKSGVKEIRYSINNGEFITYDQPFYLAKSGQLKIQTFAIDQVNNQKITTIMTDKSNISFVDLNGPTLGHLFEGPSFISRDTAFITMNTKIRLSSRDDAAGSKRIEYNVDKDPIQEYTKPFSIESDGQHVINYTGYDNVDNSNSNTFIVVVDNVGPRVYFRFSIVSEKKQTINDKTLDVYPSHVVLFVSSTDMAVGYEKMLYSVNGAAPKPYTSLISDFLRNKAYKIDVTSIDKLGNKSTESIEFFIE
jgi:hypothetical protein